MPTAIACPKCKKKYSLPDTMLGKPIKCPACKTMFKVGSPAAPSAATKKHATTATSSIDPQELASMGLGGPLRSEPDLFGEVPSPQAGNPLGNHVVVDPGFAEVGFQADDEDEVDPMQSMFQNPALANSPTKSKESSSSSKGKKRVKKKRKGKRKIHPAIKENLDKATLTLFIVGVVYLMIAGFFFINARRDVEAQYGNIAQIFDLDEEEIDEEFIEGEIQAKRIFWGIAMGIGIAFCLLGLGVQFWPITCATIAIIFYCCLEGWFIWQFPIVLADIKLWLLRIVILGALGKAMMDGMNARWFEQAQRERGLA